MKKTKILYWVFTGLLSALMLLSSIPDIMQVPQAKEMVVAHLGYPPYFVVFIGIAKLLGVIALLFPGFPKLKEWAYAGFTFDLIAAMYSSIAVGDPAGKWAGLTIGFVIIGCSYFFHHKKMKETAVDK